MSLPTTIPVETLNRTHPFYDKVLRTWNQVEVLNCGGWMMEQAIGDYLRMRPKEPTAVLEMRKRAASYTNLMGNITGWYDSALWQQQPAFDITPGSKEISDFLQGWESDVTRTQVNSRRFFKGVVQSMLVNKCAYVLLDMPTGTGAEQTLADQQAGKLLSPYLIEYRPQTVINWGEDEFGGLQWAVLKTEETASIFPADPAVSDVWTYYDAHEVARWTREKDSTEKVAKMDPGYPRQHATARLNKIPLYRLSVPDGLWFGNRVKLPLLNHFNLDNALDWGLMNSCLAQLYIKGKYGDQSVGSAQPTVSEVAFHQLEIGGEMGYVEPKGIAFKSSQERLDNLEERIYKACFLQAHARTNKSTPTQQSGISKQQDMTPANDALSGIGDVARPALELIYTDVLAVSGMPAKVNVRGFDFNDKGIGKLEMIDAASVVPVQSTTFERRVQKDVVHILYPDEAESWYKTVEGEIDIAPTPNEQAQAAAELAQQAKVQSGLKFQKSLDASAAA